MTSGRLVVLLPILQLGHFVLVDHLAHPDADPCTRVPSDRRRTVRARRSSGRCTTAPWKGAHQRRTLLYKYCQSHLAWSAPRVQPRATPARNRGVVAIGTLKIRMFEAGDGFRLLGAVGAVPGAEKVVTMRGGYETSADGAFELDFRGPVPDAQPGAGIPRTAVARCPDQQSGDRVSVALRRRPADAGRRG